MQNTANQEKFVSKKKLNLIQVFRGLASLLVVLAHGSLIFHINLARDFLSDIFSFGGSGVDFFFVLSGFIIFYTHRKDIAKQIKFRGFILKRFMRIYPIYWVVLTGKLLSSLNIFSSETHQYGLIELIKAYLLIPQDRVLLSSSFLGVSWTLSYEIFFYLMFCLLICLKHNFFLPIIFTWLSIIFLNFLGIIEFPKHSYLLHLLFSELNLEFIFGALAAYFVSKYEISYGSLILYVGLFLYTLSAINYHEKILPLSSVVTFGLPFMILTIGAVALEMSKSLTISPTLIFLGDASYSIYLIHGFVINHLTKAVIKLGMVNFLTQNSLVFSLFAIFNAVIALMVGCAMYLYLEKPLLSIMRRRLIIRNS
ncbi:MAG: acyltransferase [Stigonema ocellatum SAG 48.90 = DSM 106950]|nr:acyltransferase [Stigonema ocellatum SAG 48.90 = DSM 106950]